MTDATPPATPADTGGEATPAPAAAAATPNEGTPPANPTPPPNGAADSEAPKATGEFKLPEEYKDKPWATKIKSETDLWKQIENLQIAVGKKTVVPDLAKATTEEREAYYAGLRPADVAEYGLESVPADVILPSVRTAIAEQMLKNGVSAVQAKPILEAVAAASLKEKEAAFSAENFTAEAEKTIGKGYDPKPLQAALKGVLSAETYKGLMDNVPNSNLVQIHKAMKEVVAAYGIKESGAHIDAGQGAPKPADVGTQRQELRNKIVALSKRPHEAAEKQVLIDALNATYVTNVTQQGA